MMVLAKYVVVLWSVSAETLRRERRKSLTDSGLLTSSLVGVDEKGELDGGLKTAVDEVMNAGQGTTNAEKGLKADIAATSKLDAEVTSRLAIQSEIDSKEDAALDALIGGFENEGIDANRNVEDDGKNYNKSFSMLDDDDKNYRSRKASRTIVLAGRHGFHSEPADKAAAEDFLEKGTTVEKFLGSTSMLHTSSTHSTRSNLGEGLISSLDTAAIERAKMQKECIKALPASLKTGATYIIISSAGAKKGYVNWISAYELEENASAKGCEEYIYWSCTGRTIPPHYGKNTQKWLDLCKPKRAMKLDKKCQWLLVSNNLLPGNTFIRRTKPNTKRVEKKPKIDISQYTFDDNRTFDSKTKTEPLPDFLPPPKEGTDPNKIRVIRSDMPPTTKPPPPKTSPVEPVNLKSVVQPVVEQPKPLVQPNLSPVQQAVVHHQQQHQGYHSGQGHHRSHDDGQGHHNRRHGDCDHKSGSHRTAHWGDFFPNSYADKYDQLEKIHEVTKKAIDYDEQKTAANKGMDAYEKYQDTYDESDRDFDGNTYKFVDGDSVETSDKEEKDDEPKTVSFEQEDLKQAIMGHRSS